MAELNPPNLHAISNQNLRQLLDDKLKGPEGTGQSLELTDAESNEILSWMKANLSAPERTKAAEDLELVAAGTRQGSGVKNELLRLATAAAQGKDVVDENKSNWLLRWISNLGE